MKLKALKCDRHTTTRAEHADTESLHPPQFTFLRRSLCLSHACMFEDHVGRVPYVQGGLNGAGLLLKSYTGTCVRLYACFSFHIFKAMNASLTEIPGEAL